MPFPGLSSFGDDDADAALFYGRSREIAHTLEELRAMRAVRDQRPLVVLGASGAGKSSLLKAGIIPRLRREAPAWLPLRAFRPGADPLLNFAEALSKTLADFHRAEAHGTIRDRLFEVWSRAERDDKRDLTDAGTATLAAALEAEGAKLRDAANRPSASILISVDQAEEMARADGASGEALADYLRIALAMSQSAWQLAFTIRTDSFPELQSHRRFQNLEARGYDLRAIPVFRFDNVVVEPAKRYGVRIDDVLVDALMEDAPKEDALPLLAFALQRLWRQYAVSGALTKDNYDKVGGLKGLIEDAADRALRGLEPDLDAAMPAGPPPKRLVDLAASTFVPALAQINDQGATIRRVADWSSFNEDQRDLLNRFDRWRLVVRKGTEANGGTVEVAHEALFREWTRLKGWLEPERARLEALRSLQLAAATWNRQGKALAFLDHRDKRLAEAGALALDAGYAKRMQPVEFDYVAACNKAEAVETGRKRRGKALVGVLMLSIAAGLAAYWQEAEVRKLAFWFKNVRGSILSEAQERSLKPGDPFAECAKVWSEDRPEKQIHKSCPDMVVIPAGEFTMGSPKSEEGRSDDERLHKVTIAKPIAVSKFAVTFDQWDACVAGGGCDAYRPSGNDWGRGTRPVINVNWTDAQQYVDWLNRITGTKRYRLLSEAEWEYAARAGTTTAYPWGDEIGKGNANCSACGSQWDGKQTAPVGSFAPNKFGLHDMHGNVWQWVQDCYNDIDENAPKEGAAAPEQASCRRVVRGGSWNSYPQILRSAYRNGNTTVIRKYNLGFRVGRTLSP